ncbi:hypothetical protein DIURU_004381 [Diutina rugosa]|uniref:protein-tyrosine-phosphatase n=1 Tax=Diutina rugosa TaxID=5481 RepID=A0A642UPN2_DIURU|nr:uncharacterized protein DIURU_004381 [Diutina rugosa]KAA8899359.1 hypothetical protein DIURU_004381 [Diutina rugosa]
MKNLSLNLALSRPHGGAHGADDTSIKTPIVASTPTHPPAVTAHLNHSNDSLTLKPKRPAAASAPPPASSSLSALLPPPPRVTSASANGAIPTSNTTAAPRLSSSPPLAPPPGSPRAVPSLTQLRSPVIFSAPEASVAVSPRSLTVSPLDTPPMPSTAAPHKRFSTVSSEPSQSIFSDDLDRHPSVLTHRVLDADDGDGDDYYRHYSGKRAPRPAPLLAPASDIPPAVPEKTNEALLRKRTVHKKHQSNQLRDSNVTLEQLASAAKQQDARSALALAAPPAPSAPSSASSAPSAPSERRRRARLSPSELNAKALPPLPSDAASGAPAATSDAPAPAASAPAPAPATTPELSQGTITTTLLTPNSRSSSSASSVAHTTTVTYVPYAKLPEELQEQNGVNAYADGPRSVLNNRIFLFSDPQSSAVKVDINDYDLVVNVAKECPDLTPQFISRSGAEYVYIPWQHTSAISQSLPSIVAKMAQYYDNGKRILVHCQCGVSRSACVIVAFFMSRFSLGVNQAYDLLKQGTKGVTNPSVVAAVTDKGNVIESCDRICPNMSLIFELMEYGDSLKRT